MGYARLSLETPANYPERTYTLRIYLSADLDERNVPLRQAEEVKRHGSKRRGESDKTHKNPRCWRAAK